MVVEKLTELVDRMESWARFAQGDDPADETWMIDNGERWPIGYLFSMKGSLIREIEALLDVEAKPGMGLAFREQFQAEIERGYPEGEYAANPVECWDHFIWKAKTTAEYVQHLARLIEEQNEASSITAEPKTQTRIKPTREQISMWDDDACRKYDNSYWERNVTKIAEAIWSNGEMSRSYMYSLPKFAEKVKKWKKARKNTGKSEAASEFKNRGYKNPADGQFEAWVSE